MGTRVLNLVRLHTMSTADATSAETQMPLHQVFGGSKPPSEFASQYSLAIRALAALPSQCHLRPQFSQKSLKITDSYSVVVIERATERKIRHHVCMIVHAGGSGHVPIVRLAAIALQRTKGSIRVQIDDSRAPLREEHVGETRTLHA